MEKNNDKTNSIETFLQKTINAFDSKKQKDNQKHKYIAIDSDILRVLTLLDILRKNHGHIEREKIHDDLLRKDFNYYVRLYNCIIHDEIRLLIVDAVYQESKHSPSLVEFMKEYCYFPNVNAVNYQEKAEKARKLAHAYTEDFEYEGVQYDAPMQNTYVADIKKYVPTNDCYIMAQATIEQCPLLTANGKHFIFNKRNDNPNIHDRVKGIAFINIISGYYTEMENGEKMTPTPILIHTLGPLLKNVDNFETMDQIDDKVKGSSIL